MLRAIIYEADIRSGGGYSYPLAELKQAVEKFTDGHTQLVAFDEYPGSITDLTRVAASASLHMDGKFVVAELEILDTPNGNIMRELLVNKVALKLMPIGVGVQSNGKISGFRIDRLILPVNPSAVIVETDLRKIQRWTTGEIEQYTMYELTDK